MDACKYIPIINGLTGLYAGLIIFGFLGYFSQKYNLPLSELPIKGPGLVFITYPACL
jgi:SNF family Na+-dependent transporter